jgi:hypothetical protein
MCQEELIKRIVARAESEHIFRVGELLIETQKDKSDLGWEQIIIYDGSGEVVAKEMWYSRIRCQTNNDGNIVEIIEDLDDKVAMSIKLFKDEKGEWHECRQYINVGTVDGEITFVAFEGHIEAYKGRKMIMHKELSSTIKDYFMTLVGNTLIIQDPTNNDIIEVIAEIVNGATVLWENTKHNRASTLKPLTVDKIK